MLRIGIYGGSFNPVHFGHVGLARWVIEHTDLDELWLMVSPNNPLKPAGSLAPEQERLEAVREAIQDIPHVKASDFEFSLPRPSYTANTLRELQKTYPEHEFTLVIGEDNLAIFDQWREWEYIAKNFRILVYPRNLSGEIIVPPAGKEAGLSVKRSFSETVFQAKPVKEIRYLSEAPTFDISSTAIRHSQGRL
jgi:nicotinate-nucleotide adenylyltransferase